MKRIFFPLLFLMVALGALGAVTPPSLKYNWATTNSDPAASNYVFQVARSVGGPTNGIQVLNGVGTNTTLSGMTNVGITTVLGTPYIHNPMLLDDRDPGTAIQRYSGIGITGWEFDVSSSGSVLDMLYNGIYAHQIVYGNFQGNFNGALFGNASTATTATSAKNATNFFGQLSPTNYNFGIGANGTTVLAGNGTWVANAAANAINNLNGNGTNTLLVTPVLSHAYATNRLTVDNLFSTNLMVASSMFQTPLNAQENSGTNDIFFGLDQGVPGGSFRVTSNADILITGGIAATGRIATLTGFYGNGVGLTNLPFLSFNLPWVDVTKPPFNAFGDGSHDDTTNFQYAADWIWTNGNKGLIYAPTGRYKINNNGINFHPNMWAQGSGNAVNATNGVGIFGDGEYSTIFDCRLVTTGVGFHFSPPTPNPSGSLFVNPKVGGLTLFGPGWNGGSDNTGVMSTSYSSQGIFFGFAGNNSGNTGGTYAQVDHVRIMWFSRGITISNWVTFDMDNCRLMENTTNDIYKAHSDSDWIANSFFGTVSATSAIGSNHCALRMVGVLNGSAQDVGPGNGTTVNNIECDGQFMNGDNLNAFVMIGGDVETPGGIGTQCAYQLNGACKATFIGTHCNFNGSACPQPGTFIWRINNLVSSGYNGTGIQIENPDIPFGQNCRNYWVDYNEVNGIFYPPRFKLGSFYGGIDSYDNPNNLVGIRFNTNTWYNIVDDSVRTLKNGGPIGMAVGANAASAGGESLLMTPGQEKHWNLSGYSVTNGTDQTHATGMSIVYGGDIGLMSYDANNSGFLGNTLSFGYNYRFGVNGQTYNNSPDLIDFWTANSLNGPPIQRLRIDTNGNIAATFNATFYGNGSGLTNITGLGTGSGITANMYGVAGPLPIVQVSTGSITNTTSYEPETLSWINRAGIVSVGEMAAADYVVKALKANSLNTKLDAFYPFSGGTSNSTAMNLMSTNYPITWNGVTHMTFNTNGVQNDGNSTAYGLPNYYLDGSHAPYNATNYTQNSASLGVYMSKGGSAAGELFGAYDNGTVRAGIYEQTSAGGAFNADGINDNWQHQITTPAFHSPAFVMLSRTNASGGFGIDNENTDYDGNTSGTIVTGEQIALFGRWVFGFPVDQVPTGPALRCAWIGASMTTAQAYLMRMIVTNYYLTLSNYYASPTPQFIGIYNGNGGGLTNLNTSYLTGGPMTNAGTLFVVTNPVVTPFWTNKTGSAGTLAIDYTLDDSSVSGNPGLCMTNGVTGEWFNATNSSVLSQVFSGRATFRMAPNEWIIVTNKSSGNANITVDGSWFRP